MPCVCPHLSSKFVRALKAGIVSRVFLIIPCESEVKGAQSCLTLCDPMDSPWNSPGQNTGVGSLFLLQAIFPKPRDQTQVSCIAGRFFTS